MPCGGGEVSGGKENGVLRTVPGVVEGLNLRSIKFLKAFRIAQGRTSKARDLRKNHFQHFFFSSGGGFLLQSHLLQNHPLLPFNLEGTEMHYENAPAGPLVRYLFPEETNSSVRLSGFGDHFS